MSYTDLLKERRLVRPKERDIKRLAGEGMPLDEVARTAKTSMDRVLAVVHDGGAYDEDHDEDEGVRMDRPVEPDPSKKPAFAVRPTVEDSSDEEDDDEPDEDVMQVNTTSGGRGPAVTEEEKDRIEKLSLSDEGLTVAEIAERVGRSYSTVNRVRAERGVTKRQQPKRPSSTAPEDDEDEDEDDWEDEEDEDEEDDEYEEDEEGGGASWRRGRVRRARRDPRPPERVGRTLRTRPHLRPVAAARGRW